MAATGDEVEVTKVIETFYLCRPISSRQEMASLLRERLNNRQIDVLTLLVLARQYYSRVCAGHMGVKRTDLTKHGMFESAVGEARVSFAEFAKAIDDIMRRDQFDNKRGAVMFLMSCIPDSDDDRYKKFVIQMLCSDETDVHVDYGFFVRYFPESMPWVYMWPSLGDRCIIGCMRPHYEDNIERMLGPQDKVYMQKKYDGSRYYLIECADNRVYMVSRKGHVRRAPDGWPYDQDMTPKEKDSMYEEFEKDPDAGWPENNIQYPDGHTHYGDFEALCQEQDIINIYDGELLVRAVRRNERSGPVLPATSVTSVWKNPKMYGTYVIFDALRLDREWVTHKKLSRRIHALERRFEPRATVDEMLEPLELAMTYSGQYDATFLDEQGIEGIVCKDPSSVYCGVIDETTDTDYYAEWLGAEKCKTWIKKKPTNDTVTVKIVDGKRGSGKHKGKVVSLNMIVYCSGCPMYLGALTCTNGKYQKMIEENVAHESDGKPHAHQSVSTSVGMVHGVKCTNGVVFKQPMYVDVYGDDASIVYLQKVDGLYMNMRNARLICFRDPEDAVVKDVWDDAEKLLVTEDQEE